MSKFKFVSQELPPISICLVDHPGEELAPKVKCTVVAEVLESEDSRADRHR